MSRNTHVKTKHTLIIGGTRGTGRALVRKFAGEKQTVSVIGRHPPCGNDRRIPGVHYWTVDVSDENSLSAALAEIVRENGKLNSLLLLQRYKDKVNDWAGELEISLTATRNIIERLAGSFDKTGQTTVVIISSVAGEFVADDQPISYHVAKAGLNQMVRYYAATLGKSGVRVNGISPGIIFKAELKDLHARHKRLYNLHKRVTPLGRMCTPDDIARVAFFLCSPEASFVTGQNIVLDGGLSLKCHDSLVRAMTSMTDRH